MAAEKPTWCTLIVLLCRTGVWRLPACGIFSFSHTLPEVTVKARQPLLICRGMMGECLSQPTTHTLRHLLPQRPGAHANHINTIIAPHSPPFLTENKTPTPNLSSHPLEPYPPCDYHSVFVGPPCSLCHLPLPWRQQLFCPHHSRVCDDVTPRGRGSCHLLRVAPKVSAPPPRSAPQARSVPWPAAGLDGWGPRLGLSGPKSAGGW